MKQLLVLLTIVILLTNISYGQGSNKLVKKPLLITVANVNDGLVLPTVNITGSAYFTTNSSIAAENSGKVTKVFIKEGDFVKVNQPIATLDTEIIGYSIMVAEGKRKAAKLQLDKSKRDFQRNNSLFKQSAISEQKYQDSVTDYENAQNSYEVALAEEKKLKVEMDKMVIKSPIDGVVINKSVDIGEWVSTGTKIADIAELIYEAQIYIPEKFLKYLHVGQKVSVSTLSKDFEGIITSINYKGDPSTRTFLVKIYLGSDSSLKEGILANVIVPNGVAINSLLVPRDAVIETSVGKGVYKIDNGIAKFIPVQIVGYSGTSIAVSGNLIIGDKVVVKGIDRVVNGMKVTISNKAN